MVTKIIRSLKLLLSLRFWVLMTACILFGAMLVGPFLRSSLYRRIAKLSNETPLIGQLIDVEGMIAERLLITMVPLLVVWSLISFLARNREAVTLIKEASPFLSHFTSKPGTFLAALGFVTLGIYLDGLITLGANAPTTLAIVAAIIIFAGFVMRVAAEPTLEEGSLIMKYPGIFGWLYLATAFAIYGFVIIAKPLGILDILLTAVAS